MHNINETLLLFTPEEELVYKQIKMNNSELLQFENVAQVWFLIIKKNLFEQEYKRAMKSALANLQDLNSYLQDNRRKNPAMFKLKQTILRKVKGYEIIFTFIKEGEVVFEILEDIIKKKEGVEQAYRQDIFELICSFFKECHQILMLFCEGNLDNQLIVQEMLPLFLDNKHVNFG